MLAHVNNRITYSGNGNATEFAYQFKILDRTDIKVLLTDADGKEKLLTKDYYVDVEKNVVRYPGYAVGAEVPESERPPVLPTGWKLTIYREVPVTQETDLPDQYPFNQVEDIGDKLTMIAQQLTDVTSRSLKISVSKSADIDATIPWENGKSFRISDDGAKIELTEDPARVLPLAQGVYAQAQAQAQSAYASAVAAAKSEDSAFESAGVAGNSAQYASASAASAAESAELTSGYKQEALTAKNAAATSATNAKASEANAKQASVSASASETEAKAAKVAANEAAANASNSASEAKRYESEANSYAENAKEYAATATTKASETTAKVIEATDEANRAKAEADRAKSISDNIGNPVSDVTENNGSVTVTKSDGTQSTFMAFPQGENGALPIEKGGTGATSAADARSNLGLGSVAVENVLPIEKGGTGATTAYDARSNLGVDVDVFLADATLLWQNPKPTSSVNYDSMTLSQPYTNFKRLLFIASRESNGYTYVSAGFINVDILSANIELARNNSWTYVTYMVGTSGSGIHGKASTITTTKLHYATDSGLRPQFIYGYK